MTIVITGAAAGLGLELAQAARTAGHAVIGLDLVFTEGMLTKTDAGWRRSFDVSKSSDWEALVGELAAQSVTPDILINDAGIGAYGPIAELTQAQWERQLAVSLTGPWLGLKYLLPIIPQAGTILNIGSRRGLVAVPERSAYVAAKFGLRGATLAIAAEYPDGPSISVVELDSMLTNFTGALADKQSRRHEGELFLDPQEVAAEIIRRLASPKMAVEWKIKAAPKGMLVEEVNEGRW